MDDGWIDGWTDGHVSSAAFPFAFQHLITIFLWTGDTLKGGVAINLPRGAFVCLWCGTKNGRNCFLHCQRFTRGFADAADGEPCCVSVVRKTSVSASLDNWIMTTVLTAQCELRASLNMIFTLTVLSEKRKWFDFMEDISKGWTPRVLLMTAHNSFVDNNS